VEIAYLAGDQARQSGRQLTDRQCHRHHLDAIDGPTPDAMEWAQRDRRFARLIDTKRPPARDA
jgi:hypothetical protein